MNRAVIFCSGLISNYDYVKEKNFTDSLLICADGGLAHMNKLGLVPDVFIGDNDSWRNAVPDGIEVIQCPCEKDYTDTQMCIDYAIRRGCYDIEIYGCFGGRIDHEFSHFCLLAYGLKRGAKIVLSDEHNDVWIADKPFVLKRGKRKYVSFFPFGDNVEGFSLTGLKYLANDIVLECSKVTASSNEFADDEATVEFKSGTLLVMLCDDMR